MILITSRHCRALMGSSRVTPRAHTIARRYAEGESDALSVSRQASTVLQLEYRRLARLLSALLLADAAEAH